MVTILAALYVVSALLSAALEYAEYDPKKHNITIGDTIVLFFIIFVPFVNTLGGLIHLIDALHDDQSAIRRWLDKPVIKKKE